MNNNQSFQSGREAGRTASTFVASADQVTGEFLVGASLAGIGPTAGTGLVCSLASGGACAIPTGGALLLEGGMVASGTLIGGYGLLLMSQNSNPYKGGAQTPQEIQKAIQSLKKNITEHEAKLEAYIEDPWKFDNQGLLKNAPNVEVQQQIIAGRIKTLQNEINRYYEQLRNYQNLLER